MEVVNFFTVSANFDMRQHSELIIKSYKKRENALKFAKEMKDQFINQIPNGELDLDDTTDWFSEPDEELVFYGVCKDGENFVSVRITPDSLEDI